MPIDAFLSTLTCWMTNMTIVLLIRLFPLVMKEANTPRNLSLEKPMEPVSLKKALAALRHRLALLRLRMKALEVMEMTVMEVAVNRTLQTRPETLNESLKMKGSSPPRQVKKMMKLMEWMWPMLGALAPLLD